MDHIVTIIVKQNHCITMLHFVDWSNNVDFQCIAIFPEVLTIDATHGKNKEKHPLVVCAGTGTDNN
jgi:hypothetical protein